LIIKIILSAIAFGHTMVAIADDQRFQLSTRCPPGFQLTEDVCQLRSLYQRYDSLKGAGIGGLKTGLPSVRDRFTPQQIDLGKFLFFDPVMSRDHSLSCASCHHPDKGFSDGKALGVGINGKKLDRSTPSLWNIGFFSKLLWDGGSSSLEDQMKGPLFSEEEMGNDPDTVLEDLNSNSIYFDLFKEAFPRASKANITLDKVFTAIAAFESSLISLNSRYDQYAHGYDNALKTNELAGLNIFRSSVSRCSECHNPPLFSNQQIAVIGTPEPNGLEFDQGAGKFFPSQRGGFRVPTLRNIALTAPYMHSGRFESLRDVVNFYNGGRGHAIPEGESLNLHWHIWEPELTDKEIDHLISFLKTLNDESFKPSIPAKLPSGLHPVHNNPVSQGKLISQVGSI
jgi:cytochrome c peroxidase